MMSLLLLLRKCMSFVACHWKPILVIIGVIVVGLVVRRSIDTKKVMSLLKGAQDDHKREVKALNDAHQQQVTADAAAAHRALAVQEQLTEAYLRDQRELDAQQQKRVKAIIKQFKDDPETLAREIEKTTGVRVLVL